MKTAELKQCRLCSMWVDDLEEHLLNDHSTTSKRLEQIQLDAAKSALELAANNFYMGDTGYAIQHKILSLRDNLTLDQLKK